MLATAAPSHAQLVVYDPAVTYRNSVTAALKEYLLQRAAAAAQQLRRMAQRLSMFTNLGEVPAARRAALADARLRESRRSCSRVTTMPP